MFYKIVLSVIAALIVAGVTALLSVLWSTNTQMVQTRTEMAAVSRNLEKLTEAVAGPEGLNLQLINTAALLTAQINLNAEQAKKIEDLQRVVRDLEDWKLKQDLAPPSRK